MDNIGHNPSSRTASDSLHGTAISLFQYPSLDDEGVKVNYINIDVPQKKKLALPEEYANVQPIIMPKSDPSTPPSNGVIRQNTELLEEALHSENRLVISN